MPFNSDPAFGEPHLMEHFSRISAYLDTRDSKDRSEVDTITTVRSNGFESNALHPVRHKRRLPVLIQRRRLNKVFQSFEFAL